MPKAAAYALIWSPERDSYELYRHGDDQPLLCGDDDAAWVAWLEAHGAFGFQGRAGRLNLLKEARKGGAGYWYAYRRQGKRTRKRYAGRSAELSFAHLEALAEQLEAMPVQPEPVVPQTDAVAALPTLPLLTPKLQLPRLSPDLIDRARLLALLDAGLARKLTLVCAPAGCGKTTLVRQWLDQRQKVEGKRQSGTDDRLLPSTFSLLPSQIAWLSLDSGDNDPVRFWRYLISACQAYQADGGQAALASLAAAARPVFEPLSLELVLTTFLNMLMQAARNGILVLEDYHVVTAPQIHETLAFFLDHLPATLHVLILTRSEPLLPLARLRAKGELAEVGIADLRFSQDETRRFFQQSLALPLAPEISRQLDDRLEGWAVGLRLLMLVLQSRASSQSIEELLANFAGSHRPLLDYFVGEVLSVQPPPIQAFLLQTSVLGRLNGSLCDAILGIGDRESEIRSEIPTSGANSQLVLEELERANLFLEPLDEAGQWYRYHALFAEAMLHEARRRFGDSALQRLAQQASIWYEQHGMAAESVEAALQAQDWERAALQIEQLIELPGSIIGLQPFTKVHEFYTLRRWLEQLPGAIRQRRPLLSLYYAIALLFSLRSERLLPALEGLVEHLLDEAEVGLRATDNIPRLGEVMAYRAFICKHRGELHAAMVYARQALDWLPAAELTWRTWSMSVIGTAEAFDGAYHKAQQTLQESLLLSEASGNRIMLRAHIGMLAASSVEQGHLHRGAAAYRQNLIEAREEGDHEDVSHAMIGLAQLAYQWNDLETAFQYAQEVLTLGEQLWYETFQVDATIVLGQVQQARGQTTPAQQRLATMLLRISPQRSPQMEQLQRELVAWQARIALAAGDLAAVRRWAGERTHDAVLSRIQFEQEELILARLRIAERNPEAALEQLAALLPLAREQGRIRSALEMQAVIALALAALNRQQEAVRQIRVVLASAQAEGYMRLFIDEGAPMEALLAQSIDRRAHSDPLRAYIEQLLAMFHGLASGPAAGSMPQHMMVEPLSPQEQRVLRLLAAGRSNAEIASELVVSVNTVRTHVQSIYRKLDVNSRSAAGAVARGLRLT